MLISILIWIFVSFHLFPLFPHFIKIELPSPHSSCLSNGYEVSIKNNRSCSKRYFGTIKAWINRLVKWEWNMNFDTVPASSSFRLSSNEGKWSKLMRKSDLRIQILNEILITMKSLLTIVNYISIDIVTVNGPVTSRGVCTPPLVNWRHVTVMMGKCRAEANGEILTPFFLEMKKGPSNKRGLYYFCITVFPIDKGGRNGWNDNLTSSSSGIHWWRNRFQFPISNTIRPLGRFSRFSRLRQKFNCKKVSA